MVWVRLDDQFPDHPKVSAAGPCGAWLHVCGIAYCNRHLTDGFIPAGVAHRLTNFDGIDISRSRDDLYEHANCESIARDLCNVGLWEEATGGYLIHDYLDFQPSKESVLNEREKAKRRRNVGRTSGERTLNVIGPVPGSRSRKSGAVSVGINGSEPDGSKPRSESVREQIKESLA